MFKLVILSALLAVAAASKEAYESAPALLYSAPIVQEHGVAKVGELVKTVPTAVSHQSSTVVHNSRVVAPLVAPVVKTYVAAPIVKTVRTPLVQTFAAPVVKSVVSPLRYGFATRSVSLAAPSHYTYTAPLAYRTVPLTYAAGF